MRSGKGKQGGTADSWPSDRRLWLGHVLISRNGLRPADKALLVWGGEWPGQFAYSVAPSPQNGVLSCSVELGCDRWPVGIPTMGRKRLGQPRLENTNNSNIQSTPQYLENLGWPLPSSVYVPCLCGSRVASEPFVGSSLLISLWFYQHVLRWGKGGQQIGEGHCVVPNPQNGPYD